MSRLLPIRPEAGLVVLGGIVATLTVGTLIGRDEERLAVLLVGGIASLLLLMSKPRVAVACGGILVFAGGFSFAGIPLSEVGAALIIAGIVTAKSGDWRLPLTLVFAVPVLTTWLTFVAFDQFEEPAVVKRFTSLLLWVTLLTAVSLPGQGRRWVTQGLLVGLLISGPASMILGSTYGTRWAGMVGDPNAFALVVVATTPLVLYELRLRRPLRLGVWLLAAALVLLADSRTGMLSLFTALVVYALIPYLRAWALGVPFLTLTGASRLPDDVVQGGRWEDRLGSDELRERIDAAGTRQIQENLWTGKTLGEGKVDLAVYGDPPQDYVFFLHNSYKSLITETGVIGVGLYAVLALGAVVHGLRGSLARGALAGISAAAVMATQLGEVLFAIPVALAFGFAWASSNLDGAGVGLDNDYQALDQRTPSKSRIASSA